LVVALTSGSFVAAQPATWFDTWGATPARLYIRGHMGALLDFMVRRGISCIGSTSMETSKTHAIFFDPAAQMVVADHRHCCRKHFGTDAGRPCAGGWWRAE